MPRDHTVIRVCLKSKITYLAPRDILRGLFHTHASTVDWFSFWLFWLHSGFFGGCESAFTVFGMS